MDFEYLKIIITIILAIFGWIVAHYFTSKRDVSNKKREIVLNYLIEAYFILTNDLTEEGVINQEKAKKMEKIVSQVQLFGTKEQVRIIKKWLSNKGVGDLAPLFNSLRDDLRKELGLDKIEDNVQWARYNFKN